MSRFLDHFEAGLTINACCEKIGRSRKTYEKWRNLHPEWAEKVDLIKATQKVSIGDRETNREAARKMGFAAWRQKYLGMPTYWHQQQWIDIIEGREPRDLHDAETYIPGHPGLLLINTPVFHAKSTTITIDYVTYRVCTDPNVRIAIISRRDQKAAEFLSAIKDRLTQPRFAELIKDFAPDGGYRATADSWTSHRIYVGVDRDNADPNPTVQALGIGSQIYGSRLDLIIIDDAITSENVNEWEKQLFWLNTQVLSRPGPSGAVLVVGTRLAPHDLYGQLLNNDNYEGNDSPWTYMAQPAFLEEPADEEPEGKPLWPYATIPWGSSHQPCNTCIFYHRRTKEAKDCLHESVEIDGVEHWPRWDRFHLEWGPKRQMSARQWELIYMQRAIPEDSTFPERSVMGAVNKRRKPGKLGGWEKVPENCYWLGSLDPATSGNAYALLYAVDKTTKRRYVVDGLNMKAPTPATMKNLIKSWATEYPMLKEWVVEKTGLLTMFTQDAELNSWLAARGIRFSRHYTGRNKWDEAYGVASMGGLFGSYERTSEGILKQIHEPLIELPELTNSHLKLLASQLIGWTPDIDPKKVPCDAVMALWFAEIRARELVKDGDRGPAPFRDSPFITAKERKSRRVIDLSEYQNRIVA